jgi:MFS family permease
LGALLLPVAKLLSNSSLGYGLLLGFFGAGAVAGAVVLQRAQKVFSVETVISAGAVVFAAVTIAVATLRSLWMLCVIIFFGGAAWTVFMSVFNTLVQTLAPDWVRSRVLAIYLFVFQGSVALGSALWGFAAERTGSHTALLFSGFGIGACVLLQFLSPLPDSAPVLDVWNHWKRPAMFVEPTPDQGPVLVTVEYSIEPEKASDFLDVIHKYERVRRRDGASRWGVFFDPGIPGRYLESFLVHSWGEHARQHARFTVADRKLEERVYSFALEPPKVRHLIYAERIDSRLPPHLRRDRGAIK